MTLLFLKVAPIIMIFLLGIILRRSNALSSDSADSFLKFLFHVSFPASIILSIHNMELTLDLIFLPIIPVIIVLISYFVARLAGGMFNLPKPTMGVFMIGSMIINTGFTFPFFMAAYGQEGFARASLYDLGNGIMILTLVYLIAIKYGNNQGPVNFTKKFLGSTPLWALLVALILNITGVTLPLFIIEFLTILSHTLIPLVMISLGLSFTMKVINFRALFSVVAIRMLLGFGLGFIFVNILGLDGLNRNIVLVSSAAPVGFNTMTYAAMEKLDKEFAASVVSVSILIGIVMTPILLYVLPK